MSKHPVKELRTLASILLQFECFEKQLDLNICRSVQNVAKRKGIDPGRFFFRSLRQSRGRVYLVSKKQRSELLICFEHPSISRGERSSLFSNVRCTKIVASGLMVSVYLTPFTSENLQKLAEEFPDIVPHSMKTTPRFGLGVRMLFTLPPLLQAIEKVKCRADFQLSAGREFSLKEVIEAPPGKYPEWLGHTGLDAATLYGTIARECFKFRLVYGAEIDHAIVSPEPSAAISRIRSKTTTTPRTLNPKDGGLEKSMAYNYRIIEEATQTGFVAGITTDTSALFREDVDDVRSWPEERLRTEYETIIPADERSLIEQAFHPGVPHIIPDSTRGAGELTYTQEELMRLTIKFWNSLLANKNLHEHMTTSMRGKPFTFEISLDEAYKSLTTEKELFFYLSESNQMGMKTDLIAPNIGFRKRDDYVEDLTELENRVRKLAAIVSHFGAILDFHSGSDKRSEVYQTISRATDGKLKLKMAGIFQILYFETLASFAKRTEERKLFDQIWNYTLSYAERKASEGDDTARRMLQEVKIPTASTRRAQPTFSQSPKDEFFRHYSFITVAAKNRSGRYIFRNALYKIAEKPKVVEKYNRKVIELTIRTAKALGLEGSTLKNLRE